MVDAASDPDFPQCWPDRSGFWSGETLRLRLDKLIEPYRWQSVECASYHLRLGGEAYVTPTRGSSERTKQTLDPKGAIEIPPGQLAFLLTKETVTVPHDAIAFVSMRTKSAGFRGLINVSGFHVDPGYSGKLIFTVFNAGPAAVHVTEDEELFLIYFADLDRYRSKMVRPDSPDKRFDSITGALITPVSEEFLTFKGIDHKLNDTKEKLETRLKALERDNAVMRWASALIVGFLIALAVRSIGSDHQPLVQGNAALSASGTAHGS